MRKTLFITTSCILLITSLNSTALGHESTLELYLNNIKQAITGLFSEQQVVTLRDIKKKRVRPISPTPADLPYGEIVLRAAQKHRLDPLLLHAIIYHESRYNSKAVSRVGAQGLMQLMPGTAEELGVKNPFDVRQNVTGGARYYRTQLNQFGNHYTALLAYNSGPGNVRKGVVFKESDKYARGVLATWKSLHHHFNQ